jgi:hypothetical protein
MEKLGGVLETYPVPSYVVSALDLSILVANDRAVEESRACQQETGLVGLNLVDIANADRMDVRDHPAFLARHGGGVHHRQIGMVMVVASRMPDVPTRPPCVLVTLRRGDSEPLAVADHMRIVGTLQIANAIQDVERSIAIANRMLVAAAERMQDLSRVWEERIEAYASTAPNPYAEFGLMDAANERSEQLLDDGIDLSGAPSTVLTVST